MAICRLLRLKGVPILRQLHLEEALLRADDANYCIINEGTPEPAIVLGISGWVLHEAFELFRAMISSMQTM